MAEPPGPPGAPPRAGRGFAGGPRSGQLPPGSRGTFGSPAAAPRTAGNTGFTSTRNVRRSGFSLYTARTSAAPPPIPASFVSFAAETAGSGRVLRVTAAEWAAPADPTPPPNPLATGASAAPGLNSFS